MAIGIYPATVRPSACPKPVSLRRGLLRLGLIAAVSCAALLAGAADWPQYRGPGGRGIDDSQALPTHWNVETGENIRWQTPLPGLAHASPIVWGDRVYVATAVKAGKADLKVGLYGDITPLEEKEVHQWRLLAMDKETGKIVWNTLGHEGVPRAVRHPKASPCNSTPATDGKRIVAFFGSEGLFCFDMAGKLVWQKDLGPMDSGFYLVPSAQWGFGSSPVIADGKVIVLCDVLTNSFLAAFELADGKELWRTARKDVPTWGTPTVVETARPEDKSWSTAGIVAGAMTLRPARICGTWTAEGTSRCQRPCLPTG